MSTIQIQINGEARQVSGPQPLSELLAQLPDLPANFAVAVNENFVPRPAYPDTTIEAGDQLELLVPMQGG
ncbi:thiamine biosynthesis protein ThiS [Halioglobus japonicus]|uniref:Thiamine biosynthesis protein ThiS n=1 Tax=Halioglobus japonicus TaxID=930805 RepID=A0AAP8MDT1_9GAMM|nr:sulfur carrier protein ThiS [Halioglobus japonicus]AQA17736.1 thiamine biosynthesis protein ThiS [Halioglobus japonicus]PLW85687.1 thiamine biosynthesis protein ThiS [Halioglobus japonicus]GHD16959.1 hypothetical protein GCM10007052_22930 [Halioglobus japonicus]